MGDERTTGTGPRAGETEWERLDRNLEQLLGELRVALPGVQILFAFLLTVPFTQAFSTLSDFERDAYFVVLMTTALATAFLIAPTAIHRILFRQGMKEQIVMRSNRLTLIGIALLAAAMCSAVTLIAHIIFGETAAIVTAIASGVVFAALWFVMPLADRRLYNDGG
jgi:hypothetical protein